MQLGIGRVRNVVERADVLRTIPELLCGLNMLCRRCAQAPALVDHASSSIGRCRCFFRK
jgi:hypothetical protein